ncbi:MAG: redoxin domain-containing protein [Thermomicrobiales bacterium]|nr:redoxin domain-containing protein [Thermomicrobiales bacterium]
MASRYAGTVRAPEFPPDAEWIGPRLRLRDLRGKLTLLDFWTYCCINCMHVVPNLHELERRHPDELVVIGVHSPKFPAERETANIAHAVARLGIPHPVINDADHTVWSDYAVNAWPTIMLIDPHGRVIGTQAGEFELDALDAFITAAITEFDSAGAIDRRPLDLHIEPPPDTGFLRYPAKVLASDATNRLYIADSGHHRIIVTTLDGEVVSVIGSGMQGMEDGPTDRATFNAPHGLTLSPDGKQLAVCDTRNHAIRLVDLADGNVSTVAGTGEQGWDRESGPARSTPLASPWDIVWREDGLWITMAGWHQIWKLDLTAGYIAPVAGTGAESIHDGTLAEATFAQPSGISFSEGAFFIADSETSAVRRIDPAADRVTRIVGRGLFHFGDIDARGDSARLQHPLGITAGRPGDRTLYLADSYNHKIKALDPVTRSVITLFGNGDPGADDGPAAQATFYEPGGLSYLNGRIYVADTNNGKVRVCDLESMAVRTLPIGDR